MQVNPRKDYITYVTFNIMNHFNYKHYVITLAWRLNDSDDIHLEILEGNDT